MHTAPNSRILTLLLSPLLMHFPILQPLSLPQNPPPIFPPSYPIPRSQNRPHFHPPYNQSNHLSVCPLPHSFLAITPSLTNPTQYRFLQKVISILPIARFLSPNLGCFAVPDVILPSIPAMHRWISFEVPWLVVKLVKQQVIHAGIYSHLWLYVRW